MTISWREVSPYSGKPVEEDAPTNFGGQGTKIAMPPDAMMKKKKVVLKKKFQILTPKIMHLVRIDWGLIQ